jgi:3-phenylpropionate/trans-cinnamate dioxygenase ferredoxin subunit
MTLVKAANTSEIPVGKMKAVEVQGKEILLANVAGMYYAIGNRCTHMRGELSRGTLSGKAVSCPRHGSVFDVTTGKAISGAKMFGATIAVKDEPAFVVKVEAGSIYLDL